MVLHALRHTPSAHHVRGFTLIEMMVVMAIFTVLTTVTLASNTNFGGTVTLETLAYDVALSVRQAQVYGIAVQRFGTIDGGDFSRSYGIHFDRSSPQTYLLFADTYAGDGLYECPDPANEATCELVQTTTIQGGYYVADLCVRPTAGSEVCGLSTLNIVFKRPEPDAFIRIDSSQAYEQARVVLASTRGGEANILVELSGQISVR